MLSREERLEKIFNSLDKDTIHAITINQDINKHNELLPTIKNDTSQLIDTCIDIKDESCDIIELMQAEKELLREFFRIFW